MSIDLVISLFDKDISWLKDITNKNVSPVIYRKGDIATHEQEIVIEPNVGRDVHTFFYHILHNYDKLADVTFFVQDYPFDHWGDLIEILNSETWEEKATLKNGGYYGFHNNTLGTAWSTPIQGWLDTNQHGTGKVLVCNNDGSPQDLVNNIDVNEYWSNYFTNNPPSVYEFMPGGHFGVTKEQVRLRPKEFYERIVHDLATIDNMPWIIERLECYIFSNLYDNN